MSFPLFQADSTKEETLYSMTKDFLILMASASEPKISINQKLILKKKPIKLHFLVFREVSLLELIYFTTLEKDFFLPSNRIISLLIFANDKYQK